MEETVQSIKIAELQQAQFADFSLLKSSVGRFQQAGLNPPPRPSMSAPPRRQSRIPPSGHANRPARIPPGGRPCRRRPAGKAVFHRRTTPTSRPPSAPPRPAGLFCAPNGNGAPLGQGRTLLYIPAPSFTFFLLYLDNSLYEIALYLYL